MIGANCAAMSPIVSRPPQIEVSPPKIELQAIDSRTVKATKPTSHISRRYLRRQYHRRRRETTSSARSSFSAPYSAGAGISLCATTSTRPRNAATPSTVPTTAQNSGQPARS